MKKTCTKCKEELPLAEFSPDKRSKDRLKYWCKKCSNVAGKQYRGSAKGVEFYKEYYKKYYPSDKRKESAKKYSASENGKERAKQYRQSDEGKKVMARYNQTEKGKVNRIKQVKKWNKSNPIKLKAGRVIENLLRNGGIVKFPCETCGELRVHAHHCDYSKPLDVTWLCPQHHNDWHKLNGPGLNG